jgi:hypothetical protein
MKKLKMIVTSVVVLAIVGGAFAFKTKAGAFCITSNTSSTDCTTFKQDFRITTDLLATQYKYYPAWDGNVANCNTNPANTNCTATFRLTGD